MEDLSRSFGETRALNAATLRVRPSEIHSLVGENGSGKSTLLRVVTGLMQPSQGSVTLLGAKSAREVAHRIGYMGHAPLLYDELNGMENLRYFAGLYGLSDDAICRDTMRLVGLDPELERRIGQYSQGMRQRLSLARAVLHDPELERLLGTLHARSDEQVAAIESYHAQRAQEARPPTADELKTFRRDKLVALDRDKAQLCYQLCRTLGARRMVR